MGLKYRSTNNIYLDKTFPSICLNNFFFFFLFGFFGNKGIESKFNSMI